MPSIAWLKLPRLRAQDPSRYGTKGSTERSPGYVPRGWREAVRAATQAYYQTSGNTSKKLVKVHVQQ